MAPLATGIVTKCLGSGKGLPLFLGIQAIQKEENGIPLIVVSWYGTVQRHHKLEDEKFRLLRVLRKVQENRVGNSRFYRVETRHCATKKLRRGRKRNPVPAFIRMRPFPKLRYSRILWLNGCIRLSPTMSLILSSAERKWCNFVQMFYTDEDGHRVTRSEAR